jgi:hypothetical protein
MSQTHAEALEPAAVKGLTEALAADKPLFEEASEPFVPEEEEPAAEWRNGQTQGDHLMFAKAKRQSRASQCSVASRCSVSDDEEW